MHTSPRCFKRIHCFHAGPWLGCDTFTLTSSNAKQFFSQRVPPFHLPTLGWRVEDVGSRLEAVFRLPSQLWSRDDLFSLSKGRVWSAGRRRSVAEGCGLETRELQHASRDTISERWGERTHSKTQSQPRLHPSALAAAGLLLPKIPLLKNLSRKIARFFCLKNPSCDRRKSVY